MTSKRSYRLVRRISIDKTRRHPGFYLQPSRPAVTNLDNFVEAPFLDSYRDGNPCSEPGISVNIPSTAVDRFLRLICRLNEESRTLRRLLMSGQTRLDCDRFSWHRCWRFR